MSEILHKTVTPGYKSWEWKETKRTIDVHVVLSGVIFPQTLYIVR